MARLLGTHLCFAPAQQCERDVSTENVARRLGIQGHLLFFGSCS